MIKKLIMSIIFLILIFSATTNNISGEKQPIKIFYRGENLYVGGSGPENYTKIKYAIENASNGDTIFVFKGVYQENVYVNKKVNIIGENKSNTIIDGKGKTFTVQIIVDDVFIANFSIVNATDLFWPDPWELGGLGIYKSRNVTIKNNIFSNNFIGICIFKSSKCTLRNNLMYGCNMAIWGDDLNAYIHDIDSSNRANERPISYNKDKKDVIISGDLGEVFLINCTNCSVSNLNITKVTNGIQVCYSNNIIIKNSIIKNINSTALHFDHSNNNIVCNNTFLHHKHLDSIFLDLSKNNIFKYNIVKGYGAAITLMRKSNFNMFYKNDLSSKNLHSMIIDKSNWNKIICNNINGSFIKKALNKNTLGVSGDVLLSQGAFFNKFYKNYWRERILNGKNFIKHFPKIIFGVGSAIVEPHTFPIFIDFDFHPANEPYQIS